MEIYVSTAGCDEYSGTKESPFRTIERARDEVRLKNKNMSQDIVVFIREGLYELSSTLEFDHRDSGTNDFNIIYKAYDKEKVVISGGISVTGWEKSKEFKDLNLYEMKLSGIHNTRHLYINGRQAARPKSAVIATHAWEKATDETIKFWNYKESIKNYMGELKVYEGYKTENKSMSAWRNQRDIEFVYDVGWAHAICPVEEIVPDGEGAIIKMRMPCFRDCQIKAGVQVGAPSYMENVFELMCNPGEWYFDRSAQVLYYIPLEGEDISSIEAVVPVLKRLIAVKGTLEHPVKNIKFHGLELCHSTCLTPTEEGYPEIQANLMKNPKDDMNYHSNYLKLPSAIVLSSSHHIAFSKCHFHRLGSGAIDIEMGSQNNTIRGNEFYLLDGSGIQLGDFNFNDAHPEDEREIVKDNIIDNNYFHNIGEGYRGSVAVLAGYTEGTVITHNEICDVAYSGISVGWGWGYCDPDSDKRYTNFAPPYYPRFEKPGICKRNRIEYNHIHHVMQKLHDGGGIYTLSLQPDSTIIGNHIHDNGTFDGKAYHGDLYTNEVTTYDSEINRHISKMGGFPGGIYMDEASGGFEITGNVVYNVAVPCFYHNIGMNNRIRTNYFHDNFYNLKPEEYPFAKKASEKAGLEENYKYLKK